MQVVLFDPQHRNNLLPLVFTKSVADLRVGAFTLKQKWERHFKHDIQVLTQDYLQPLHDFNYTSDIILYINAGVCPKNSLYHQLVQLKPEELLVNENLPIAYKSFSPLTLNEIYSIESKTTTEIDYQVNILKYPWDIFNLAEAEIAYDLKVFELNKYPTATIFSKNTVFGNKLFVHPSAKAQGCIFNTETGPIYLDENAEVMEGSIIRGPFYLGKNSTVKMGAKIYGATSIGPYCKVGGEISNSVFQAYSNKGHDGFVGNSVIGEWCNFGADTNTSNLKNNYSKVSVYNYQTKKMEITNQQFVGVIMGDHAKTGINTMLNTGTVVGVSSNIFGSDFPPKYIPNFYWGGKIGEKFLFDKACEVAQKMMERRNVSFTETDRQILRHIYEHTA